MAKTTKSKKAVTKEVAPKEEVIKEVAPSIEEVHEAVAEKKEETPVIKSGGDIKYVTEYDNEGKVSDVYAEVKLPLDPPVIEVKEEDLSKYEPDTIDHFAVFAKAKEEKGDKVWVKDHNLLKKVEGRQFTLSGTTYLGELKSENK